MTIFKDLYGVPDEERIELAIKAARDGNTVAVCIDDTAEKRKLYLESFEKALGIKIIWKGPGPVKKVFTIKIGPKPVTTTH